MDTLGLGCGFVVVACGLGFAVIVIVTFNCWFSVVRLCGAFDGWMGLLLVSIFGVCGICGRLLIWCFILLNSCSEWGLLSDFCVAIVSCLWLLLV